MKNLIKIINNEKLNLHNVMATILDEEKPTKTLISGYEIVHCNGCLKFFKENLDEIVDVRTTGVYEIGGKEVYCEVLEAQPELVVCGAGHVALACIKIAHMVDMHITCIEDRQEFADMAKEAGADVVICDDFAKALETIEGGENIYFLSMTRAHAFDQNCLEKILPLESAYVGMLGSAKKIAALRSNLEEKGFDGSLFDKLHSPVGLDINAQTPEEIAVAVLGEVISIKNAERTVSKAFSHEQMDAISSDEGRPILATIVRKHVTSPREIGTKMVFTTDGDVWGTVGGGLAEAEAIKFGKSKLDDEDFTTAIIRVGDENISEDGMVCGGVVDVLFERL